MNMVSAEDLMIAEGVQRRLLVVSAVAVAVSLLL